MHERKDIAEKIRDICKEFGRLDTDALKIFLSRYWDIEILRDIERLRDYFLRSIRREKELESEVKSKENKIDELEGKLFMKPMKITARPMAESIECAIANHFDWRRNIIVPNVSWGLGIHECDMLIVTPNAGYATEVEIKISKADLLKDKEKRHHHRSDKIKRLYFAVPAKLAHLITEIPEHAGFITVEEGYCEVIREAIPNRAARSLSALELAHVAHLGCMRIWGLKTKLQNERHDYIRLNEEYKSLKFPQDTAQENGKEIHI